MSSAQNQGYVCTDERSSQHIYMSTSQDSFRWDRRTHFHLACGGYPHSPVTTSEYYLQVEEPRKQTKSISCTSNRFQLLYSIISRPTYIIADFEQ